MPLHVFNTTPSSELSRAHVDVPLVLQVVFLKLLELILSPDIIGRYYAQPPSFQRSLQFLDQWRLFIYFFYFLFIL